MYSPFEYVKDPKIKEAMDTLLKMFDEENLEKIARAVIRGKGSSSQPISGAC